jgi:hypothetical protein
MRRKRKELYFSSSKTLRRTRMLRKEKIDAVGVGRDEQTRSSPTTLVLISIAESHGLGEQLSLGESEEDNMESCNLENTVSTNI